MEAFAGYLYYQESYGGTLSEEAFRSLAQSASFYVNQLTGGRAAVNPENEAVKMAVCSVVEAMHRQREGGIVASESVGSWSRSFATGNVKSSEQLLYDAAMQYLADSGLSARWC